MTTTEGLGASGVLPAVPGDWTLVDTRRAGPFLVRARLRRSDGSEVVWTSRGPRKGHALPSSDGSAIPVGRRRVPVRTW